MSPRRFGAVLVAAALGLAACARTPAPASSPAPSATPFVAPSPTHVPIHEESEGHDTLDETANEHGHQRPLYELRALSDVADRLVNGDEFATFDQAHITFHAENGKLLITDSPRARVTYRTKDVFMSGGVRAQTEDGGTLTCRTLRYDGRTERIYGEGDVRLTNTDGMRLSGDHLIGNVRLDHVRITSGNAR